MNISSAYNKNRTQYFTMIDEIELAIHETKNTIEKRNVKQQSYMTVLERDIDDVLSEAVSVMDSGKVAMDSDMNTNRAVHGYGEQSIVSGRGHQ